MFIIRMVIFVLKQKVIPFFVGKMYIHICWFIRKVFLFYIGCDNIDNPFEALIL